LPRRRRWPRVERGRRDAARGLAELDRPVGLVEERLPRLVLLAAQPQRDQRVASGLLGGPNQLHAGLLGRAAPFAGVAPDAGADEVLPRVAPALRARLDVIDRKIAGREVPAAVLALVAVPCEEVPPVEL